MNTRKPGINADIIAEYRLLNAIAKNKEHFLDSRVNENTFINEIAKSIYSGISELYSSNISITPASLYQACNNIDYNVTNQIIQEVFNIDDSGAVQLDDILSSLKTTHVKKDILAKIDEIKDQVSKAGDIDNQSLLAKTYELDSIVQNSEKGDSKLLSFNDWADVYLDDLQERKSGRKYSFGDPLLDQHIFKGAAPGSITIIAAQTNMGKSTYVLSLVDNCIDTNIPCIYISHEMGTIDTMDRLMANRLSIENRAFYKTDCIDDIIEQVKQEQTRLQSYKNFAFIEATSMGIPELRAYIREYKQRTHNDYALVAIDLLSNMKGFMTSINGASTATNIEINMKALEALAKEENVHIIGVVQLNRQADNLPIKHLADIKNVIPKLTDLKNSGAYAETGETVILLHRPKFYADRYCKDPEEEEVVNSMEDILEAHVLKDRNNQAGAVLYYSFVGKYFKLFPKFKEEEIEQAKNLFLSKEDKILKNNIQADQIAQRKQDLLDNFTEQF